MVVKNRHLNGLSTNIWKDEFRDGNLKCVSKMYLTKVWSKFFKKGTTSLIRFGTGNLAENPIPEKECNYFLLNVILKDFMSSSSNYKKPYIDNTIITGYRMHFKSETKKIILKKWLMEKFSEETRREIKEIYNATNQLKKLETYVQTSEYLITVVDMIMFMASTRIPILLIYQSKKTPTRDGIKLFYMVESEYYYVIKLRNHKIFMLHMWSLGKNLRNNVRSIRFTKENMTDYLKSRLVRVNTINDYLASTL